MRCDVARTALSARFDGEELDVSLPELDSHLAECDECAGFRRTMEEVRHHLRLESIESAPDLAGAVTSVLPRRRPRSRRYLPAAAVFIVGCMIGAAVIAAGGGPKRAEAETLGERVLQQQRAISSLQADVEIVERGWNAHVPERRFTGHLRYRAPESLALELSDQTTYPSDAWVPNDVTLIVDGANWWARGPRSCPPTAQPDCTPHTPDVLGTTHREPFADATPVPLELITPVRSFVVGADPRSIGTRVINGRTAIGVTTTAAQLGELLADLRPAGNLRDVNSADPVDLWLDQATLVPVEIEVRAADSPDRARWATERGATEHAGDTILTVRLSGLRLNESMPDGSFPARPSGATVTDMGFVDAEVDGALTPAKLPEGFTAYRSGVAGDQSIETWTDGRAWLKLSFNDRWPGGRLFGGIGSLVRRVDLGAAGIGYASEDGTRVAIHGDRIDLLLTGSVAPSDLQALAGSLGIVGLAVPASWAEASTTTLTAATVNHPGLLVPSDLPGFAAPAVRDEGNVVSIAYAGPGLRAFLLTADFGGTLLPTDDPDALGLVIRSTDGRWSPAHGELTWVEGGATYTLHSETVALGELLGIAKRMRTG